MAKPPKLANVEKLDDFSHWLADTIQQQVSKENAGFVQIERGATREEDFLLIQNGRTTFRLEITQEGV